MREIKFRGKRVDNGEWIEGDLIHTYVNDGVVIANIEETRRIIPETVGQFTGLKDKNGVEIFEEDIVNLYLPEQDDIQSSTIICTMVFENHGWYLSEFNKLNGTYYFGQIKSGHIEVIGNIHTKTEPQ